MRTISGWDSRLAGAARTAPAEPCDTCGCIEQRHHRLDRRLRELLEADDAPAAAALIGLDDVDTMTDDVRLALEPRVHENLHESLDGWSVLGGCDGLFIATALIARTEAVNAVELSRLHLRDLDLDDIGPGLTVRVHIGIATGEAHAARSILGYAHDALELARRLGSPRVVDLQV